MRLRNIPKSLDFVYSHPNFVNQPENFAGKWAEEHFHNTNPVYLEIGCGKGKFIITHATQNPSINYIAMEKYLPILGKMIKKLPEEGLPNLAVFNADAENLPEYFGEGEIEIIFLNFSDPWPKKRHTKRRLTNPKFLEMYKKILKENGCIIFKTDNRDFFEYSIEQFELAGFSLQGITYDLHNSPYAEGNVTTEYEEKFLSLGQPIYRLSAHKTENMGANG
ncbi:tRNA (guanine-N(7)-)-methyltransferase TrmB [Thermoclostridium stercorarium subsp. stercorarium DSM 8532]|uniref:tRNA (guanine-N(7)-)-methyltransferase n=3 Tax=Thermoclostridium stercorarium TaxID=1510 RepID=L7VK46_THES1|nr:tRNA (guanosine(46)-N7)-methyltransferase TrmB [Thermoclostridium stercorarium]AGC68505.1 tRNA (guanine-N(7)-)-methyltransferase TrmB [Thermoclostridium stercorarium subsp. stercorarium DSM 8532]AGI39523.1 tRNA-guanine-N7-methyltransferase [Thermoclostridium stercorarium subsp. stercorarium DSM 8532]ANW98864.1 tRNA (guanosine(46)-N7)-methyltransferase TrmB [Thermoclostridium stercorarium subsp. thermolacticum DSM 2910]ANX01389.1 tRNA (guanosine(46)-N7)-methyltransferase TrmB [Thermoclostridi